MSSSPSSGSGGARSNPQPATLPVTTVTRLSKWLSDKFRLLSKVNQAKNRRVKRGYVYWCEFGENIGSEQCSRRPALVLQNNAANFSSPNVIVAPITNTQDSNPSVYELNRPASSPLQGYVLAGNTVTVSKARLGDYIDCLDEKTEMPGVEEALYNAVGVGQKISKLRQNLDRTTKHLEQVKAARNEAQDALRDIRSALKLKENADQETILEAIEKLKSEGDSNNLAG